MHVLELRAGQHPCRGVDTGATESVTGGSRPGGSSVAGFESNSIMASGCQV